MAGLMAVSVSGFAQDDLIWNALDPDNTVYLEIQEGMVVIQLNPVFAPKTVKHFKITVRRPVLPGNELLPGH